MADTEFTQPISEQVWRAKYSLQQPGRRSEHTLAETRSRVALALSAPEAHHRQQWLQSFEQALAGFRFLPGGRIMAGAGAGDDFTLFNCFVTGTMHDSIGGIFSTLAESMLTLQAGGGIGCDFSTLRPAGAAVGEYGQQATGPVRFLRVWEEACNALATRGPRRAAMMATLRCDHPDIEAFIDAGRDKKALRHFNLSVLVTDAFMRAVADDGPWSLMFPVGGRPVPAGAAIWDRVWSGSISPTPCMVTKTLPARELWERLCRAAFDCGDPGVLFIDRIAQDDNLYYGEPVSATNPCGEVPLPPHGACNLGSINLTQFVLKPFTTSARLDMDGIRNMASVAVRMLDNVYDCSSFPLAAQKKAARASRRIGLGITGLADALAMLGVRYGSPPSLEVGDAVMRTICLAAYERSVEMVAERGRFPAFRANSYLAGGFVRRLPESLQESIRLHGIHNSHLTAIAPAGSISLLANNVSSGIEPVYAFEGQRRISTRDGQVTSVPVQDHAWQLFRELHPGQPLPAAFVQAADVAPAEQLKLQAACQAHVDQAVSKTINLPAQSRYEDVRDLFNVAFELGLKGCTMYRAGESSESILSCAKECSQT
ncbi:adenosylcobalamin-dependent ribonucleoside-diphosphate reductase [Lacisediminimonas profundi]|uniref:adenosylcobalamin-dependent ribonucleoside-diphosphate reductase n=1 Tax=Lacisediminimonas profundi TaxID=2603856 RepID=UPI00124BAC7B|nr:adenosylcobalamin-dependent ribonucleoside-diphosphate reductase [Lacisediminimonas profundi]